jgi:hypothetical protein
MSILEGDHVLCCNGADESQQRIEFDGIYTITEVHKNSYIH